MESTSNYLGFIVSIAFVSFLLLLTVALITSSYQTRVTIFAVDDFVNNTMYKGYFTETEYEALLNKIPIRNIKINLAVHRQDMFEYESSYVLNMVFTQDIFDSMVDGRYTMNVGDILRTDVIEIGRSNFDVIIGAMAGQDSSSPFKLIVSRNAVISNVKYTEPPTGP